MHDVIVILVDLKYGERKLPFYTYKNMERKQQSIKKSKSLEIPLTVVPEPLLIDTDVEISQSSPQQSSTNLLPPNIVTAAVELSRDLSGSSCNDSVTELSQPTTVTADFGSSATQNNSVDDSLSVNSSVLLSDSEMLRAQQISARVIPDTWCISEDSFSLSMMHVHKVVYAITIARNCSWSLSVGSQQISRRQCLFLRDIPLIFSCVDQMWAL